MPKLPKIEIVKISIKLKASISKSTKNIEIKVIPLFNLLFLILISFVLVGYTAKRFTYKLYIDFEHTAWTSVHQKQYINPFPK